MASSFLLLPLLGLLLACQAALAQEDDTLVQAAAALGVEAVALAQAVQHSGVGVRQIAHALQHDEAAHMTSTGGLHYRCSFHRHDDEQAAPDAGSLVAAASEVPPTADDATISLEDTFKLHSRPSATRKIYLAFQGCVTEGTAWNTADNSQGANGTAVIVTPNFDMDGDPASFSDQEKRDIAAIWRSVSEDFALWDVDVTTEDPGPDGIDRTNSLDMSYGTRVCIGGQAAAWMAGVEPGTEPRFQPLGVAFVGVFGRIQPASTPDLMQFVYRDAFVFSGVTTSIKSVWEACSHETGHTLGLLHDGVIGTLPNGSSTYYSYFTGNDVWGPIMGYPHSAQFSHWSNGTYPDGFKAQELQDDLAVMSDVLSHRLPRLPDEAGNSEDDALQLCILSTCSSPDGTEQLVNTTVQAVANSGSDKDFFVFVASRPGPLTIKLDYPPNWRRELPGGSFYAFRRGNLRLRLVFVQTDIVTVTLQEQQPADVFTTQSVFVATLPAAGNYSFYVEPTTDLGGGYSLPTNYGNVGAYQLSVQFPGFEVGQTPVILGQQEDFPGGWTGGTNPGGTSVPGDCSRFTACNPTNLCTDCVCSSPQACSCNAAEGFVPGTINKLPQCLWALAWSSAPAGIGFFQAKAGTKVQLPWLLQAGKVRSCPAPDKAVVQAAAAGITIGSKLVPCPRGRPTTLKPAAISQSANQQGCKSGSGYTVFAVNVTPAAASKSKDKCRSLTVRTSDGRRWRGVIRVTK